MNKRVKSTTHFGRLLSESMINESYGKQMEKLRKRKNKIEFVTSY